MCVYADGTDASLFWAVRRVASLVLLCTPRKGAQPLTTKDIVIYVVVDRLQDYRNYDVLIFNIMFVKTELVWFYVIV